MIPLLFYRHLTGLNVISLARVARKRKSGAGRSVQGRMEEMAEACGVPAQLLLDWCLEDCLEAVRTRRPIVPRAAAVICALQDVNTLQQPDLFPHNVVDARGLFR